MSDKSKTRIFVGAAILVIYAGIYLLWGFNTFFFSSMCSLAYYVFVHLWAWIWWPQNRFAGLGPKDFDRVNKNVWFWVSFAPFGLIIALACIFKLGLWPK